MKVHWVVQNNLNKDDRVLVFIFDEHKIPYTFVDIIPFSESAPMVESIYPIIARGSTTMMKGAKNNKWSPGVWHNDNFRPSIYKEKFKEYFLNKLGQTCTIDTLLALFEHYNCESLFIRPDSDYKELSGEVYKIEEAQELIDKIRNQNVYFASDIVLFAAPLIDIKDEYRVVVIDGKAVSASSYKINKEQKKEMAPQFILDFANSISGAEIDEVYCLDIGVLTDGTIGVIECNCFNGSGLYGDLENIVLSVSKFVEEKYGK